MLSKKEQSVDIQVDTKQSHKMALILRFLIFFVLGLIVLRAFRSFIYLQPKSKKPNTNVGHSEKKDPYQILEIHSKANGTEIKRAYLRQMAKYHPDKVEHLGEELQVLAQQKTREIGWAYDTLTKSH
ncbi:MAG: DnaJ domain-containing protein [Bdellovibrionales bacterium]